MTFLVVLLVIALLVVDSILSFIFGWARAVVHTVEDLEERGWTIEPPEEETK